MWRDRRNCEALKVTADALKILKKFPAKRMDCPYCEKSVYALPSNLTEDGKMLDWCCQECGEPIETVLLARGETLKDYLRKVRDEEFPMF